MASKFYSRPVWDFCLLMSACCMSTQRKVDQYFPYWNHFFLVWPKNRVSVMSILQVKMVLLSRQSSCITHNSKKSSVFLLPPQYQWPGTTILANILTARILEMHCHSFVNMNSNTDLRKIWVIYQIEENLFLFWSLI